MTLGKKILIGVGALLLIGIIGSSLDKSDKANASDNKSASTKSEAKEETSASASQVTIGQTLKTDYFEVTIKKAGLAKKIDTGNEFTDVKAEEGTNFLVLETTFKNIDDESRMLTDGSVFINYNGKDYEFDKSETIMADGYGLFLDQINPLTSKTTKLVYKIPAEVKGPAYYQPGRASSDEKIFLGNL